MPSMANNHSMFLESTSQRNVTQLPRTHFKALAKPPKPTTVMDYRMTQNPLLGHTRLLIDNKTAESAEGVESLHPICFLVPED